MKKLFLLVLVCSAFSTVTYSQLDSVSVSVSFSLEVDSTSMDSVLVPSDFMTVNVWVNDPLMVGNILISVYESPSGFPMARVNLNLAELQAAGYLSGNTYMIPIGFLDDSLSYEIKTLPQNFQLAHLPEITISYP